MSKEKVWKTKEGTVIPIRNMTDQHLLNTIRMLERVADSTFLPFPNFNGEIAQFEAESQWDTFHEMSPEEKAEVLFDPEYTWLTSEAFKRELEV